MSDSIVYLFVDTNLFLQCRPMEELNWSTWNEFDEVRLIVSSPVLREIDYRKSKGSDRVSRRARAASAMFREMLNSGNKLVHESSPSVRLSVETQHKPSEVLKERLNYQERDDQLVGTVFEFARGVPGVEVRLLTHDTTPLYTASGLGLKAELIPDEWLLSPENTEGEKELAALRAENARLKKAEPQFEIGCRDSAGAEIQRFERTFTWFDPLTDSEIKDLVKYLKGLCPSETDFGSRESTERDARQFFSRILGGKEVFIPATNEEIARYRDESYPRWLESCEEVLRDSHKNLQRQAPALRFIFVAENRGTRPAIDALITLEAQGGFQIKPVTTSEEDSDDGSGGSMCSETNHTSLLPPPSAPRGRWVTTNPVGTLQRSLAGLAREINLPNARVSAAPVPLVLPQFSRHHDPNAFYYKPDRPSMPRDEFCLKCDQWRHEDGQEEFNGEISFSMGIDRVEGGLVCRIQAANLSKPQVKRVPVRITTAHVSAIDHARPLVEVLVRRPAIRTKG